MVVMRLLLTWLATEHFVVVTTYKQLSAVKYRSDYVFRAYLKYFSANAINSPSFASVLLSNNR